MVFSRSDFLSLSRSASHPNARTKLAVALATPGGSLPSRHTPIVGVSIRIPGMRLTNPLNTREHRMARYRREKQEKATVGLCLLAHGQPSVLPPCIVTFTRIFAGQAKVMDDDGLSASLKATRDSVARWLKTDDGPRGGIDWRYAQERGTEHAVVISVEAP